MYMQMLKKLRRHWLFFFIGMMALTFVTRALDIRLMAPGGCKTLPEFRADVPQDLRDTLTLLHEHELLYCRQLREGLATVDPTVYWGSDGMNSFIFFQAVEGETLKGVGVPDYTFQEADKHYFPSRQGDRRHPRFTQALEGGRIWRNLAEGDEPQHYWRVDGAPGYGVGALYLKIRGPAKMQEGVDDRDFFDDLELAWNFVNRVQTDSGGSRTTSRDTTMLIVTDRWFELIHRETNPALLTEAGDRTDFSSLAQEPVQAPTLYESVQALTGSTVWVAGVISGTNPTMVLVPTFPGDSLGGEGFERERIEPVESSLWVSFEGGSRLKHFHFPRQPDGQIYEALYWNGSDASGEPDKRWPIVFTMPREAPEDDAGETSLVQHRTESAGSTGGA